MNSSNLKKEEKCVKIIKFYRNAYIFGKNFCCKNVYIKNSSSYDGLVIAKPSINAITL